LPFLLQPAFRLQSFIPSQYIVIGRIMTYRRIIERKRLSLLKYIYLLLSYLDRSLKDFLFISQSPKPITKSGFLVDNPNRE
jgi:hypothetical protein